MTDVELRVHPELNRDDCKRLLKLIQDAFAYMEGRVDPPSSATRLDLAALLKKAQDEVLIVAIADEKFVGCMFCAPVVESQMLYVGKVAVRPDRQGQGVGQKLFSKAFSLAQDYRLKGLELETRVELKENHRTFERLGFRKIGENAHEGYDRPTSIRMQAPLQ